MSDAELAGGPSQPLAPVSEAPACGPPQLLACRCCLCRAQPLASVRCLVPVACNCVAAQPAIRTPLVQLQLRSALAHTPRAAPASFPLLVQRWALPAWACDTARARSRSRCASRSLPVPAHPPAPGACTRRHPSVPSTTCCGCGRTPSASALQPCRRGLEQTPPHPPRSAPILSFASATSLRRGCMPHAILVRRADAREPLGPPLARCAGKSWTTAARWSRTTAQPPPNACRAPSELSAPRASQTSRPALLLALIYKQTQPQAPPHQPRLPPIFMPRIPPGARPCLPRHFQGAASFTSRFLFRPFCPPPAVERSSLPNSFGLLAL